MIGFLLIQANEKTGETNLVFVTEVDVNVNDHAIQSGSWKDYPVKIIPVNVSAFVGDNYKRDTDLLALLLPNKAFKCDGFIDSEEAILGGTCVTGEEGEVLHRLIREANGQ